MMTRNWKRVVGLLAAGLLMAPATAMAMAPDTAADAEVDPDATDEDRNWSLGAGMGLTVGQGTFVSPANDTDYADEIDDGSGAFNRVSTTFSVNAGYNWEGYQFSTGLSFRQSLTPAGVGSTRPYEGRFQDMELNAEREEGFEIADTGVEISPSASLTLPVSTGSRTATLLTGLSASASISRTFFDRLTLSYSLGGGRNFHRHTSPVLDEDDIQDDEFSSRLFRPDGSEALGGGRFLVGGINTEWSMSHGFGAGFMLGGGVMVMANYAIMTGWSYPVEEDEFTHERQCSGRCPGQISMGMLMANYRVSENLAVNGGIRTMQPPKTMDNKSFNFPFYNFSRPASNRSMFTLGLSGTY